MVAISPYAEHTRKSVGRGPSMRENSFSVGSANDKICLALAEHTRKLVTLMLSLRENHFGAHSFNRSNSQFFMERSLQKRTFDVDKGSNKLLDGWLRELRMASWKW